MTQEERVRLFVGAAKYVLDTLSNDEAKHILYAIMNAAEEENCNQDTLDYGPIHDLLLGGTIIGVETNCQFDILSLYVRTRDNNFAVIDTGVDFGLPIDKQHLDVSICHITEQGRLSGAAINAAGEALSEVVRDRAKKELARRRQKVGGNQA